MDLKTFKYPDATGVNAAFSSFRTIPELLTEAKDRGFYDGNTPYNKLFNKLFFGGGKVKFKPDLDPEFKDRAWRYCRSFMGSFEPKHEHKEAICAMLMSELIEPELEPANS